MYSIIFVTATCLLIFCQESITLEGDATKSKREYQSISNVSTVDRDGTVSRKKRTIYGYAVNEYEYPYVVSVQVSYSHVCGGTILTPRLILTAAHCLEAGQISSVAVSSQYGKNHYRVAQSIPHQQYYHDQYNIVYDIALLVLGESIPNAKTVSLQRQPQRVPDNSMAYALGWGKTENGFNSQQLKRVDVPLLFPSQCRLDNRFMKKLVCIDTRRGNVCFGDSGGPIMYGNNQVGVTSYVRGNVNPCMSGMPAIFTRVSAYYDWIQQYVQYYP
ncbi:hypothetical protein QAD02_004497 [Eretmocerus hayati]|uniref:Uncharacterized protein n=1 Tax=Eretmocerus hayati TaxID=131215 RepID=A0ACC2NPW9_9HYME|nr:hypothetical protein QAD02_004497 [Eretmocerus hayati]